VLTGRAPAQFTLAAAPANQPLALQMPDTPAGLPSELLEHRPDIAGAERRAAAANANIGVAKAAYFPQLTLSASGGVALDNLFDTPGRVWSLGAALAQTIFDGGLRTARVAQAQAGYDITVAQYKETVLGGFQQVEDQLALLRLLAQETAFQDLAVRSSLQAEQSAFAQYRAGTLSYLNVVTTQTTLLNNQRTAVQLRGRLMAASISLVSATGGGWSASDPLAAAAPAASAAQPQ
jgi:NodT family efflux transporter outer membrane factor (OMF) lipoprotein